MRGESLNAFLVPDDHTREGTLLDRSATSCVVSPMDKRCRPGRTLRDVIGRHRGTDRVRFETDFPVVGDRRLFDALDALVENAVEHGSADADDDRVTVSVAAQVDAEEGVATITDGGPGIPEYARAAVFDDRPISQLSYNSGLGLWLAKWLVEGFGGRLGYERRGGQRSCLSGLCAVRDPS
ncbi:sensor histidine kinase [Halorhabdus rudnickae]|uniref:sensor histidine kinase n=1 Tax=Halorhabdus rudnickae TaxID=1775544 RepID=UPI0014382633|nr:ATP-binding protein [Halorhabdus rudnickae]